MCRLVFYRGTPILMSSLITEPAHSIIHQSYHSKEREEPLNGDGFGVGWYASAESEHPAVFKDISPAWNNSNLTNIAPVIRSSCIVGHIRAASPGLPVTRQNCHPFTWNEFMFAHNGEVGGFRRIRRRIQSELGDEAFGMLQGSTDSEHLFALFVDEYLNSSVDTKIDRMASALQGAIARINNIKKLESVTAPSLLNLILTDGDCSVITRYISNDDDHPNTLYLHTGAAYQCNNGECRMLPPGESPDAVVVASEPLSHDRGWLCIAPNTMLLVNSNLDIATRSMSSH